MSFFKKLALKPPPTDTSADQPTAQPTTPGIKPAAAPGAPQSVTPGQSQISNTTSGPDILKMQNEMLRLRGLFLFKNLPTNNAQSPLNRHPSEAMLSRHLTSSNNKSIQLKNIIDSVGNLGKMVNKSGLSEPQADGSWGDKTTTGLKSIEILAKTILDMSKRFQINIQFNEKDIAQLEKLTNSVRSNETAKLITDELIKITNSSSILISKLDAGQNSDKEIPTDYAGLTGKNDEQLEAIKEYGNRVSLFNIPGSKTPLNLSILETPELFKKFISDNKIMRNNKIVDEENILEFLTELENGIKYGKIKVSASPSNKPMDLGF